ncbi:DoxX family protein [Arenibacter latericius]|uniref:DoxX family protein n=1 Tax=Arenibacter latericius TaxID=86104 RepID=UPI0003FEBC01|nr:DoxX family protein [Arenibacter latericius]MDX1365546.1 DoxX family protein [Arenibacter latericius]
MIDLNKTVAVLTVRLILGFIFLMQGFGKVVTWGMEKVYQADFFQGTFEGMLPESIIWITAYYTSYVELIAGLLLVLGLKTNYALYALASVLVIVTFGHGLAEPIWNLSHVLFRTILLVALLLLPREWDKFSLDSIIKKKAATNNS